MPCYDAGVIDIGSVFLDKAQESLAGAESELANHRYNNAANRCYYACFQAAIAALLQAGIRPPGGSAEWGHAFVQARFVGELISRRKRYSGSLRDVLSRTLLLRQLADYKPEQASQTQVTRALRSARQFVESVRTARGEG